MAFFKFIKVSYDQARASTHGLLLASAAQEFVFWEASR
jgi:hypothetical protein